MPVFPWNTRHAPGIQPRWIVGWLPCHLFLTSQGVHLSHHCQSNTWWVSGEHLTMFHLGRLSDDLVYDIYCILAQSSCFSSDFDHITYYNWFQFHLPLIKKLLNIVDDCSTITSYSILNSTVLMTECTGELVDWFWKEVVVLDGCTVATVSPELVLNKVKVHACMRSIN